MAQRALELTLILAKDLKDVNLFSAMEVYALVSLSGDPRSRQRVATDRTGGRNPTWNATLRFTVPASAAGSIHVLLRASAPSATATSARSTSRSPSSSPAPPTASSPSSSSHTRSARSAPASPRASSTSPTSSARSPSPPPDMALVLRPRTRIISSPPRTRRRARIPRPARPTPTRLLPRIRRQVTLTRRRPRLTRLLPSTRRAEGEGDQKDPGRRRTQVGDDANSEVQMDASALVLAGLLGLCCILHGVGRTCRSCGNGRTCIKLGAAGA